MSNCGRSRNNVDTRLIGFPPRTTMRGGNDIAILHHLYLSAPRAFLPAPVGYAGTGAVDSTVDHAKSLDYVLVVPPKNPVGCKYYLTVTVCLIRTYILSWRKYLQYVP